MKTWFTWSAVVLCLPLVAAMCPSAAMAEEAASAAAAKAPFDLADPARVAAGKKRFNANCAAYCHGNEGSGGRTPPFKGNASLSIDSAFKTITEGRRTTDVMPPWGNAFTPEQIWELVAYLAHLSKQPPAD